MLTTIYKPKDIVDFIGNKNVIQPFIHWLLEWRSSIKEKCLLVSGAIGIGKTLLVELILKKHDYNIIYLSEEVNRNKLYFDKIKPVLKMKKTLNQQDNVLVVSGIDSICDHGFISNLLECIKETQIPIICTCNNRYDQSIKPILNYCFDIKMSKPNYQEVYCLLYKIVVTEKIRIKEPELKELYECSNGDIRFIINMLQLGNRKGVKNIQSMNIFDTSGKLLLIDETIQNKYETYWLANDLHTLMIQENYINNTLNVNNQIRKLENISYSSNCLSDADLFDAQINMINWELEPYVATSTINATLKCNKKTIKFSQFLGKLSSMNKNKRNKINIDEIKFFQDKKTLQKDNNFLKIKKARGRPCKIK